MKLDNMMINVKSPNGKKSIMSSGKKIGINDLIMMAQENDSEMDRIESIIDLVDDTRNRIVLEYKFIFFMTNREVAKAMHYDKSSVLRYYSAAIDELVRKLS